ncbi:hypothetical protein [Parvibaculum sp.]|uniref:hypothetical protein n=1 Tax=Parvibaculum sp. TaxID=2024848 RepID=UPI000C8C73B9|nr:hypothetical protein [Parvibaculum sp.]MAB15128.1 hypothetical protein [Parvibaculum sp.]
MRDAMEMWQAEGALPEGVDPAERARELVIAIYDGEMLAGCLTADFHPMRELEEKFAFARSFIRPAWRGARLTDRLMIDGHAELGRWAAANPQEKLAGSAAIYQNANLGARPVEPSGLTLIGFTGKGLQKRVLWFDHYRLPVADDMQAQEAASDGGTDWNLTPVGVGVARDRALREEACRFWREAKAFAPDTDLSDPAAALSMVAHDGEEMIATSSLRMIRVPALRRSFAMLRCFVAPRWRGTGLREALAAENFRLAEAEAANSDNAALPAGVLTICSGGDRSPLPVDAAGFLLAGYAPGRDQVRLRWFGHAKIPDTRLGLSALG